MKVDPETIREADENIDKRVECYLCGDSFGSHDELVGHGSSIHDQDAPVVVARSGHVHVCTVCGEKGDNKEKLMRHYYRSH